MIHEFVKTESSLVRMEAILGREIYEHLQPFEFEDKEIRISGFGSLHSFSKGNGDGIFIYVNRRYIKDRMIYRAIVEAYRHVIPTGRFPVVVLFIDLPPSAVDVNVHPTKQEVRISNEPEITAALQRVVRENPEKTALIVSHRVVTKILICAVLGLDDSHFWQIKQDTTAVNCFEYTRGVFVISLINATCHLQAIHSGAWKKDF